MIFNVLIPLILDNIYSPLENSIYYVNNDLNISWQNNFSESNINLSLLQNDAIVTYPAKFKYTEFSCSK